MNEEGGGTFLLPKTVGGTRVFRHHDTQHMDTQHNDIQHNKKLSKLAF